MNRLHTFLQKRSTLIFSFLILIICLAAFNFIQGDALRGKTGLFTMQTRFCVESMQAVLADWGEDGVRAYRNMMWVDFLFPAAYGIFLASAMVWAMGKAGKPTPMLFTLPLLPLIASMLDWVENIFHICMLPHAGTPLLLRPISTFLAALSASLKWGLLFLLVGLIAFFLIRRLFRR